MKKIRKIRMKNKKIRSKMSKNRSKTVKNETGEDRNEKMEKMKEKKLESFTKSSPQDEREGKFFLNYNYYEYKRN